MATISTHYKFLERNPKSNYKQLVVKGTKIFARTLYGQYMSEEEPRTVEELADDYDVPIEAVREAIAYCDSDPIEIREDFAREEALMEATGMNDPNYKFNPSLKKLLSRAGSNLSRSGRAIRERERVARSIAIP
jgi:uncharacterized protein (DUF433 family)